MKERKLVELLLAMFSSDELRRLVRWNWEGVSAHLPGGAVSPAALAEEVVLQLGRAGLLDEEFFRVVREQRPRRVAEIDGVALLWAPRAAAPPLAPVEASAATDVGREPFRYDLFLAHASADAAIAGRLYDELAALPEHPAVFLDARSLELGAKWDVVIPAAMRGSRVIVVLVSGRVDAAWYAKEEIAEAIALAREDEARRVVPVFLDGRPGPSEAMPYGLRRLNGVVLGEVGLPTTARRLAELAVKLRR